MPNTLEPHAKLAIAGTLEFRDAAGNIVKTVEITGSVPLSDTGLTEAQAAQLLQGDSHGADDRGCN